MTELQKQVGRNENEARAANEILSVEAEQSDLAGHRTLAVVCECGDRLCRAALTMTVDQYEEIRSEPARFAVLEGHELLDCERVTATRNGYLIVEKFGDAGEVADESDPRNHLKTCRIVIADDLPDVRQLLRLLLAREPSCTLVGEARDGAEAIEVVSATQPEVVVLDLEMPGLDGWHALPQLRRASPSSRLIVYSSTHVDARVEKRLTNLGADAIVPKGDPTLLLDLIRAVVDGGRDREFSEALTTR